MVGMDTSNLSGWYGWDESDASDGAHYCPIRTQEHWPDVSRGDHIGPGFKTKGECQKVLTFYSWSKAWPVDAEEARMLLLECIARKTLEG